MPDSFPLEPQVRGADFRWLGAPSWEEVDDAIAGVLGQPGVAIPTVRVGLCWVTEHLGYRRHRDHVLVPRFIGRCILNSVNRFALPVEDPTPRTRAVIVVDHFGARQDMPAIAKECAAREWVCIEDAPCGFGADERPFPESRARLIGFSKALPVTQGGFLISSDPGLVKFVKARRETVNAWSWVAWLAVWSGRRHEGRVAPRYSAMVNAAYELYPDAGGGAAWIRSNLQDVFRSIGAIADAQQTRLAMLRALRGTAALFPSADRLAYVVPYLPPGDPAAVAVAFEKHGFAADRYHVDLNRNLLAPRFEQAFLVPVSPRIPLAAFEPLVADLAAIEAGSPASSGATSA